MKRSFRSNASWNVNAPTTIRGRLPRTWGSRWPVERIWCFVTLIFQDDYQCRAVLGGRTRSDSKYRMMAIVMRLFLDRGEAWKSKSKSQEIELGSSRLPKGMDLWDG